MSTMAMKMSKINQIAYFDQLKEAGMNEKQAKIVLNLANEINETSTNNLVTKEHLDFCLTKLELKMFKRSNAVMLTVIVGIFAPIIFHHFGLI